MSNPTYYHTPIFQATTTGYGQLQQTSDFTKQRFCIHPVQYQDLQGNWRDVPLESFSETSSRWGDGHRHISLSYEDGELAISPSSLVDRYRIQTHPSPTWIALSSKKAINDHTCIMRPSLNILVTPSDDASSPAVAYEFARVGLGNDWIKRYQAVVVPQGLVTFIHDARNHTSTIRVEDPAGDPINAVVLLDK